jgi:glutaredoxin-like YruB-family protein
MARRIAAPGSFLYVPLVAGTVLWSSSSGCDPLSSFVDDAFAGEAPETAPVAASAAEEPLPERPADSVARSETEVITFGSILENPEMSRAERIRAFENLDPAALQKRVAQPNVSGAPQARPVKRAATDTGPTNQEVQAARSGVAVVMYSTAWCGVCKRARKYFEDNRIAFVEYDVDKNVQARNEYLLLNPRRSVPTIKVGNEVVVGFSPAAIENALNAAARAKL